MAYVRRRSSAFSRGRSRFRGVSGHAGRWEARIGSFGGRKNVSTGGAALAAGRCLPASRAGPAAPAAPRVPARAPSRLPDLLARLRTHSTHTHPTPRCPGVVWRV